ENLDRYLPEFIEKAEARGIKVFVAKDGERVRQEVIRIITEKDARCVVKSKSMTGEEIHLSQALEKIGLEVIESDLGEFIVQLREEAPFHIVFPSMHLRRGEIQKLFAEKIGHGAGASDDPSSLTMDARRALRQKYIEADVGISGVNFGIAETGQITICTKEGNGRLRTSLPRVHIALMGIEKIVPKLSDLALLMPMLATAGAGQHLTGYTTILGGPRGENEIDGPEEMHLIIMDNGRSTLLADVEQRDALQCIRCGACLNVCPIYKNVGGHTYGTTYQGPIGSVITPHLRGLQDWKHLSQASSLCGAFTATCPVKIDLHHQLLHNRRNAMAEKPVWWERWALSAFAAVASRPMLFRLGARLARLGHPLGRWMAPAWSRTRELPNLPNQSFCDWWEKHESNQS
ncbi:lactate utilization protein, partial [bacterium]|nr:lactate utilization protein [bacterium]